MLAIGSFACALCAARMSPLDAFSTMNAVASGFGTAACAPPQKASAAAKAMVTRRMPGRRLLHAHPLSDLQGVGADARIQALKLRDGNSGLRRDRAERVARLHGVVLRRPRLGVPGGRPL